MLIQRTRPAPVAVVVARPKPVVMAKPVALRTVTIEAEKPKVTTTTVAKPKTGNTAAERAGKVAEARASLDHLLARVAENDKVIDDAVERNAVLHEMIENILREHNMTEHSDNVYVTGIYDQWSRQARTVDPKKFKAHVANDVFWAAASISIGEALKHLTEVELNKISDIVPSKLVGKFFKLKKIESSKK